MLMAVCCTKSLRRKAVAVLLLLLIVREIYDHAAALTNEAGLGNGSEGGLSDLCVIMLGF